MTTLVKQASYYYGHFLSVPNEPHWFFITSAKQSPCRSKFRPLYGRSKWIFCLRSAHI